MVYVYEQKVYFIQRLYERQGKCNLWALLSPAHCQSQCLHLVSLPQRMALFLLPLFSTGEARGGIFPSSDGRSAYVELISFAFPHSCVPLLTPARPAAGCPWCCLARRAVSLSAATPAQLSATVLADNSSSSLFAGKIVGKAKRARARQLRLPAKAPPVGGKWSGVGKNRVSCFSSRTVLSVVKRMGKVGGGGWTLHAFTSL